MAARRQWRKVDGVLLLNKPHGFTSNDALQVVRRAYSAKKAGHGGTLDPLATGLLPVAFGAATRFLHDLVEAEKVYTATVRLGWRSSTGDGEGELTAEPSYAGVLPDQEKIDHVIKAFTGPISQRPPMYSALKFQGRPLYEYARAGIHIDRPAREVTVHELTIESASPEVLVLRVRCSKGTYIRVLAEDIGDALGTGAYLSDLRRDAVGRFDLTQAIDLARIQAAAPADRQAELDELPPLLPVDAMVRELPEVALDERCAQRFTNGQGIDLTAVSSMSARMAAASDTEQRWRVYGEGRFLGLARQQEHMLNPLRVLPVTHES